MNLLAQQKALEVLHACIDKIGMKASGQEDGYPEIWARDSIITLMGASLFPSETFQSCFYHSLKTLQDFQSDLGMIPLNVDTRNHQQTTLNSGGVDGNAWFIIGHHIYYQRYHDLAFLSSSFPAIKKALLWLRYQDSNNCGLLEVHEAADWADLLGNRYNILYDNVLYYRALICYEEILTLLNETDPYIIGLAASVRAKINFLYLRQDNLEKAYQDIDQNGYSQEWKNQVTRVAATGAGGSFFLPYSAFRDFGTYFDSLGNCLAILFGVAEDQTADIILDYIRKAGINRPYPLMAIYPPIYPGEKDWKEYYRTYDLNYPYHYHNGGIWPFIGGFYVAALIKRNRIQEATSELEYLTEANKLAQQDEWSFSEWIHGQKGIASGHVFQAWSAGQFLFAQQCLENKRILL